MYTREVLLDLHERAHRSFQKLLDHCRRLDVESLNRELPGFGYPRIRIQLHHVIGAEEYWVGVLEGKMLVDEDDAAYPTIEALETYRKRVARTTRDYLSKTSEADLNAMQEVLTWRGEKRRLVPALVVMRPLTHIFQHQGQVLAMCRLLDAPGTGETDFPLD